MEIGIIKMFDRKKNFGFIVMDDGEELFFHAGDIDSHSRAKLDEGVSVKFEIMQDIKGPKAVKVKQAK